eukprot:scaffold55253_cov61-Phaeocystis_antarctica.AAC.18
MLHRRACLGVSRSFAPNKHHSHQHSPTTTIAIPSYNGRQRVDRCALALEDSQLVGERPDHECDEQRDQRAGLPVGTLPRWWLDDLELGLLEP